MTKKKTLYPHGDAYRLTTVTCLKCIEGPTGKYYVLCDFHGKGQYSVHEGGLTEKEREAVEAWRKLVI